MTDVGGSCEVNTVAFACLGNLKNSMVQASSGFETKVFDAVSAVQSTLIGLCQ
jgi:hypothetical protein